MVSESVAVKEVLKDEPAADLVYFFPEIKRREERNSFLVPPSRPLRALYGP
jgi:hypothetical protein